MTEDKINKQFQVMGLMNLTEAKAKLEDSSAQLNLLRHSLEHSIYTLKDIGAINEDQIKEYKEMENLLYQVSKYVDAMKDKASSQKRELLNNVMNSLK